MKILITGSEGFIAKNLISHLETYPDIEVIKYNRKNKIEDLYSAIDSSEIIFHLAGTNRSIKDSDFEKDNINLTENIVKILESSTDPKKLIFSSSTQAEQKTIYGRSKFKAEKVLNQLGYKKNITLITLRLTNVFGKWSKPNYNTVIATLCYNIMNDIPIEIHEPDRLLSLIYIDDLIENFLQHINLPLKAKGKTRIQEYNIRLDSLASLIKSFKEDQVLNEVGKDLTRAIYSTYISFKQPKDFVSKPTIHIDNRGQFSEIIKTSSSGQVSFFTTKPGITRGGHYHHTKSEKFLVVQGEAVFKFRHIVTDEEFSISVNSEDPTLVETIPGWAHDITNTGKLENIVLLWANELFDPIKPDTYAKELTK